VPRTSCRGGPAGRGGRHGSVTRPADVPLDNRGRRRGCHGQAVGEARRGYEEDDGNSVRNASSIDACPCHTAAEPVTDRGTTGDAGATGGVRATGDMGATGGLPASAAAHSADSNRPVSPSRHEPHRTIAPTLLKVRVRMGPSRGRQPADSSGRRPVTGLAPGALMRTSRPREHPPARSTESRHSRPARAARIGRPYLNAPSRRFRHRPIFPPPAIPLDYPRKAPNR
jgi:hypothetical protein